jgi:hypothetical protein
VSPASGLPQNFTNPVIYTVTAADGTTRAYTVTMGVVASTAKDITRLTVQGFTSEGVVTGTNVAISVPFGTDVTALIPTFTITGASMNPASGVLQDFTNPVSYTVTASDGSTKTYVVAVSAPHSAPVDLGTAGQFVILSKGGVSTVPTSAVTGDVGVSPVAATYITQFSLIADATNVFSTSTQVTGKLYAADYAAPTPSKLTTAVSDMETAFTAAAGRTPDFTEVFTGNIGGKTLVPGIYKWGTGVLIPTDLTLTGSASDIWIFMIAQDLTVSNAVHVVLAGGALPKNVFWQVAGGATFGTTSHFEGIVLSKTSITLATGASINGRLLAQTNIAIAGSTVVEPAP